MAVFSKIPSWGLGTKKRGKSYDAWHFRQNMVFFWGAPQFSMLPMFQETEGKKNTSVAAIPPPPLSTPSILFRDINTIGQHLQDPGRKPPLQQHSRSVGPQCLIQFLSSLSYLVQTPRIQSVGCFRSLTTIQKYIIPTQTHHWTSKNLDLCNTKNRKKILEVPCGTASF